ncbi:MAG: ISAs1 family transposase [Deltaproteobacteria bacterium]|nr:ISAs1 family transposase [Deltaproteobacteria bacterium]
MQEKKAVAIVEHFKDIEDPRIERGKLHNLIDIIAIAICAVICGADTWEDIELFGEAKHEWLKQFLELPNGIPSHDTFGRVFSIISPVEFQRSFLNWIKAISESIEREVVAIDGKTSRRSYDKSKGKGAIHMVSAWATANRVVLGQVKTEDKSNEITAIPELLDILALNGCIVTIDAMGCQKNISAKIIEKGADYVLALKGNQGTLHEDIKLFFQDAKETSFKDIHHDFYETIDGDHGRIETRRYSIVSDIEWLEGKADWKEIKSIGMVESEREIGDKVTKETRYYISSLPSNAKLFGDAVRKHWGIENSLHWVLDVVFREDECRIRKGHAAENFAVLRHIALNLIREEKSIKRGAKGKRLKAGWDNDYLSKILCGRVI